jgi:hypothetical protein
MSRFARLLRVFPKSLFRLLNLATINDISGERFKPIFEQLVAQGWALSSKYDGFDAGIDYDCVRLRRGFKSLKCEWDNWAEWSIEGSRKIVEQIASENGLSVTYAWRWSQYDETTSDA